MPTDRAIQWNDPTSGAVERPAPVKEERPYRAEQRSDLSKPAPAEQKCYNANQPAVKSTEDTKRTQRVATRKIIAEKDLKIALPPTLEYARTPEVCGNGREKICGSGQTVTPAGARTGNTPTSAPGISYCDCAQSDQPLWP